MNVPGDRSHSPLLARICGTRPGSAPSAVFVLAHPDDETIAASVLVRDLPEAHYIYVTDGSPRDGLDAKAAGYASPGAYARARRRELAAALSHAGIPPTRIHTLDVADQEAVQHLVPLTRAVQRHLEEIRPEVVITHPYEGGHPDHDATAFAVHAACRWLAQSGKPVPTIVEMTSYHNRGGSFAFGAFLPSDSAVLDVYLDDRDRAFKERLISSYPTQERILRSAVLDVERFRIAPSYDFTQAPHSGQVLFELFSWSITGAGWIRLARAALDELGLSGRPAELPRTAAPVGWR